MRDPTTWQTDRAPADGEPEPGEPLGEATELDALHRGLRALWNLPSGPETDEAIAAVLLRMAVLGAGHYARSAASSLSSPSAANEILQRLHQFDFTAEQ